MDFVTKKPDEHIRSAILRTKAEDFSLPGDYWI
jgi:hypothetical protein